MGSSFHDSAYGYLAAPNEPPVQERQNRHRLLHRYRITLTKHYQIMREMSIYFGEISRKKQTHPKRDVPVKGGQNTRDQPSSAKYLMVRTIWLV